MAEYALKKKGRGYYGMFRKKRRAKKARTKMGGKGRIVKLRKTIVKHRKKVHHKKAVRRRRSKRLAYGFMF